MSTTKWLIQKNIGAEEKSVQRKEETEKNKKREKKIDEKL